MGGGSSVVLQLSGRRTSSCARAAAGPTDARRQSLGTDDVAPVPRRGQAPTQVAGIRPADRQALASWRATPRPPVPPADRRPPPHRGARRHGRRYPPRRSPGMRSDVALHATPGSVHRLARDRCCRPWRLAPRAKGRPRRGSPRLRRDPPAPAARTSARRNDRPPGLGTVVGRSDRRRDHLRLFFSCLDAGGPRGRGPCTACVR
jgi:hypothetical protein